MAQAAIRAVPDNGERPAPCSWGKWGEKDMSDTSQGPGWWRASDGRWYEPHRHPAALATLPPPPALIPYPPGYGPAPGQPIPPGVVVAPVRVYPPLAANGRDPVLDLPLAPWWKRLVALLVDIGVLAVPYITIGVIVSSLASNDQSTSYSPPPSGGAVFASVVVISVLFALPTVLYAGLMNGSVRGQSLGKMAMGIAVRDARGGGRLGFGRGIGRTLMAVLFVYLLVVPFVLDLLWPLGDGRRQSWHDKVVHSIVVDLQP
jgi:uncharacterized RDD family membrane protein YckC